MGVSKRLLAQTNGLLCTDLDAAAVGAIEFWTELRMKCGQRENVFATASTAVVLQNRFRAHKVLALNNRNEGAQTQSGHTKGHSNICNKSRALLRPLL